MLVLLSPFTLLGLLSMNEAQGAPVGSSCSLPSVTYSLASPREPSLGSSHGRSDFLRTSFFLFFFLFLKGVAPESEFHRNAKIARGMNLATPFPPSRVGAVQAEVL